MGFWVGIIFAILFAVWAVKQGFYETWMMLFNFVVSIYIAIFVRPIVVEFVPAAGGSSFSNMLILLLLGGGTFAILYGISFVFFSSQFKVYVPKLLDVVGSGIVGFLSGLLLWGFIVLLFSVTPLSQNQYVQEYFGDQFVKSNVGYMNGCVNMINKLVSSKSNYLSTDEAVEQLWAEVEKQIEQQQPAIQPPEREIPEETDETDVTCEDISAGESRDTNSLSSGSSGLGY